MTLGIPAHADTTQQTNAKIRLARKAVTSGSISPFATPELKRLAVQGEKIIQQRYPGDLVCDIAEHFYLGWGNGDYEEEQFQQLKIWGCPR